MINVQNVSKTFILHQQNGVRLPVLNRASLTVNAGECVVLHGHIFRQRQINSATLAVRQLSTRRRSNPDQTR